MKADIRQKDRNKGAGGAAGGRKGSALPSPGEDVGGGGDVASQQQQPKHNNEAATTAAPVAVDPFASPPVFSADGKTPRVKADIVNQAVQTGAAVATAPGGPPAVGRKQGSKKVELDRTQLNKIDFVQPGLNNFGDEATTTSTEPPFLGPDVKPDGRLPRVKANILAKKQQVPSSNKVSNEGEENKKSKKLFDSAVAPFIPTLRPRPTTTLSSLFLEPAGLTNRPEEKDQPQQEEDDGEEEEEVNGGFFTSTALPIVTAPPTFSTATGHGFDPFNLGPPPQPKIPASVLSRLPPPANRKLPVAIFTTPAPFTTAPPAQQLPFNAALGVEDNNGDSDLPRPQPTPSPDRGAGRFLPSSADTGSGRAQPRVKANELAKLNNQATRFRTSEPQKIFNDNNGNSFQRPRPSSFSRQPPLLPERVRNQQEPGRPLQNGIFSEDTNGKQGIDDDYEHNDNLNNDDDDQNQDGNDDGGLFPNTPPPLPLQEPPTARPRQNFKFVRPEENQPDTDSNGKCSNPFKCPPRTFAGGRKPRVKSNIKALDRNFWHPEPRESRVIKRRKQQHVRISPVLKAEILGRRQGRRQQDRAGDDDDKQQQQQQQINGIGDNRDKEITDSREDVKEKQQQQQKQQQEQLVTTPDPVASLQQLVREKEREARLLDSQSVEDQQLQQLPAPIDQEQQQRGKSDFFNSQDKEQQQQQKQQQLEVAKAQLRDSLFPPLPPPNKKQDFKSKQNSK